MTLRKWKIGAPAALALLAACGSTQPQAEQTAVEQSVAAQPLLEGAVAAGEVVSVQPDDGSLVVKTREGEEEAIHVNDDTAVHNVAEGSRNVGGGLAAIGKAVASGTAVGAHAVAHYSVVGGKKTAHAIHIAEKETVKTTEATVDAVDHAARTVSVQTADGAKEVYHVSEHALVKTSEGVAHFGADTGHGIAAGSKVVAHHTLQGGRKVVHFFHHLGGHHSEPEAGGDA